MTDSEHLILDTSYSIEFVLTKVKDVNNIDLCSYENLERFEAKDIAGGAAFFSKILKIQFHWKKHVDDLPKSVILKAVSVKNMRALLSGDCGMEIDQNLVDMLNEFIPNAHKSELFFYTTFPKLDPTIKVPTFYHGTEFSEDNPEGALIMEDLSENGVTLKMLPGLNNEQVEAVIDELAHIHAVSWQHQEWVEHFREGYDDFKKHDQVIKAMKDMSEKLREIEPEVFNPLLDRAVKIFSIDVWKSHFYIEQKYGYPPGLVHADLWSPNILFEKDNQDRVTSKLLGTIDWQICMAGNTCGDIARLLGLNTSSAYRRDNTERLLYRYMDEVSSNNHGKPIFTYEQLLGAYKNSMGYVMMFIAYGAPMYFNLPFVVEGPEKDANRKELLSRVASFFEDTLEVYGL